MSFERGSLGLIVALLVVANASWTAAVDHRVSSIDRETDDLATDVQTLRNANGAHVGARAVNRTVLVPILAYDTESAAGRIVHLSVVRVPSRGVHVDASELSYGRGFQRSLRTARAVVAGDTPSTGYYVDPVVPESWQFLSGESAGLPVALGLAALQTDCELDGSVAATGRIEEDGSVTPVERLDEKLDAAAATGRSAVLVPPGQQVAHETVRTTAVSNVSAAVRGGLVGPRGGPCQRRLPVGDQSVASPTGT